MFSRSVYVESIVHKLKPPEKTTLKGEQFVIRAVLREELCITGHIFYL